MKSQSFIMIENRKPGLESCSPSHRSERVAVRAGQILTFILLTALSTRAADQPVSFYKDIVPIFKRSCTGCHHPGKLKGQLDLTTYEAFQKGGKHGASFQAGKPKDSIIIEKISGAEPSMPKEGDPL